MPEPHPSTCNRCGEDVLLARDKDLLSYCLDPMPILPLGECGECKGRGTVRFHAVLLSSGNRRASYLPGDLYGRVNKVAECGAMCPVCKGTGQHGEEPSPDHVLLSATRGTVRLNTGRPRRWEAAHRRHRCTELPVRSEPRYAEARRVSRPSALDFDAGGTGDR